MWVLRVHEHYKVVPSIFVNCCMLSSSKSAAGRMYRYSGKPTNTIALQILEYDG
jgi:hypothetical protein